MRKYYIYCYLIKLIYITYIGIIMDEISGNYILFLTPDLWINEEGK